MVFGSSWNGVLESFFCFVATTMFGEGCPCRSMAGTGLVYDVADIASDRGVILYVMVDRRTDVASPHEVTLAAEAELMLVQVFQ